VLLACAGKGTAERRAHGQLRAGTGARLAGTQAHWRAVPCKSTYVFAKNGISYHKSKKLMVDNGISECDSPSGIELGICAERGVMK
jgi:hypothetical protein